MADDIQQAPQNLMQTLGIELTKVTEGYVEATMEVSQGLCQPFGYLHGGATLALAETVAGQGSIYLCGKDKLVLGSQVSANHLSSAKLGDRVIAKGNIIHQGRLTHLWNIDIFHGVSQQLITTVRITNHILDKR